MPPKDLFWHKCFVKLDKSVQNKLHKCMKKIFILGKLLLNQSETVFDTFDPGDLDL